MLLTFPEVPVAVDGRLLSFGSLTGRFPSITTPAAEPAADDDDGKSKSQAAACASAMNHQPAPQSGATKGISMHPTLQRSLDATQERVRQNLARMEADKQHKADVAQAHGNAQERWDQLVESHVRRGKTKAQAIAAINREYPGLREQMVNQFNAERRAG